MTALSLHLPSVYMPPLPTVHPATQKYPTAQSRALPHLSHNSALTPLLPKSSASIDNPRPAHTTSRHPLAPALITLASVPLLIYKSPAFVSTSPWAPPTFSTPPPHHAAPQTPDNTQTVYHTNSSLAHPSTLHIFHKSPDSPAA